MDDFIREMRTPERRSPLGVGRRRRLTATALIVALAAMGVTSLVTSALFTDTEPLSASDFQTGTVDIVAEHSATQTLGAPNMAPGDTVYGIVPVSNGGSLELRYAIEVAATNSQPADLAGELSLQVYAGVATCSSAGVAAATPIGSLNGIPTTPVTLVGNPAIGQDAGDRVLAAGLGENLCVAVGLPLATDNTYQDTQAEVTLTFLAEQTVNND